jgi:hypothetical protein
LITVGLYNDFSIVVVIDELIAVLLRPIPKKLVTDVDVKNPYILTETTDN